MKLVLLDEDNLFCENPDFNVEGKAIGIFNALLIISRKENEHIVNTVKRLWRKLDPPKEFTGPIRADLVPRFRLEKSIKGSWNGYSSYDLGDVYVTRIYEFNVRSIECVSVGQSLQEVMAIMKRFQPGCCTALADQMKKTFPNKLICLVPGASVLKKTFGKAMAKGLSQEGINIELLDLKKAAEVIIKKCPKCVFWIWGDWGSHLPESIREYPEWFHKILEENKGKITMFNTVPSKSLSDKGLLMPKGKTWWDNMVGKKNFLLDSKQSCTRAVREKNSLVLKPREGSEGFFIKFGCKEPMNLWKETMQKQLKAGGYALFEKTWLPRVQVDGSAIAMDLNPAFWLDGKGNMEHLYTIVRADMYDSYKKRGKINVAQGGGVAGNLIVE